MIIIVRMDDTAIMSNIRLANFFTGVTLLDNVLSHALISS
jgi:hypothetical protein